jgi:Flp pilus assembly protein TadD
MNGGVVRVGLVVLGCSVLLTACETANQTFSSLTSSLTGSTSSSSSDPMPPPATALAEETGSIAPTVETSGVASVTDETDPNDELVLGKRYYREGDFGQAELHFRRAVEQTPLDKGRAIEAWVGLAASYDRLRRFELADRAYAQAIKIAGPMPEILNNQGYSNILRGNYKKARALLRSARAKDPKNPHIAANLELLDQNAQRRH